MRMQRREFLRSSAAAGIGVAVQRSTDRPLPESLRALTPFPGTPVPISDNERRARIEKARRLMTEHGIGAIVLEPGTSMTDYVDVRWGLSERPFLLVIPARGELAYVAPGFEEARAREITRFTNDVRVWQEDEDWGAVVAGILKDRGVAAGSVGIEERVRFFIPEGRTDDRDRWRVRNSARRLSLHHGERPEVLHGAVTVHRPPVRVTVRTHRGADRSGTGP
jgi:Xaa-Pro dipeptidase